MTFVLWLRWGLAALLVGTLAVACGLNPRPEDPGVGNEEGPTMGEDNGNGAGPPTVDGNYGASLDAGDAGDAGSD